MMGECKCHGVLRRECDCLTATGIMRESRRRGDWMQTFTGRQYWPLDPRLEDIHIVDIAHALSMQARYGGHTHTFYSVAEHSVLIAYHLYTAGHGALVALAGLMHDAPEAYVHDIIRPIKRHLVGYDGIEALNAAAIALRFGLPERMLDIVKDADNRILHDERDQAMATQPPAQWDISEQVPPLGVTLHFWPPAEARRRFLESFRAYGGVA